MSVTTSPREWNMLLHSEATIYPFPHSRGLPSGYLSLLCRPNTESLCLCAFFAIDTLLSIAASYELETAGQSGRAVQRRSQSPLLRSRILVRIEGMSRVWSLELKCIRAGWVVRGPLPSHVCKCDNDPSKRQPCALMLLSGFRTGSALGTTSVTARPVLARPGA